MNRKNPIALSIRSTMTTIALVAMAGAWFTSAANASEELFKKSGCTACHAMEKKLVGPALKDVAAKYKGKKGADAMLALKIKNGGKDVWGVIPMPPNTAVSDENTLILAKWVLSQQ